MTAYEPFCDWHYDFHQNSLLVKKWEGRIEAMPQPHKHLEVEFSLMLKGEVPFLHNGMPIRIAGPQLNLFWGMREHQIVRASEGATSYLAVIPLSDFCALNIPEGLRGAVLSGDYFHVPALAPEDSELCRLLFERWICDLREKQQMGPGMAAELAALLTRPGRDHGWDAVRNRAGTRKKCDDSVLKALSFIITHFNQPLSLAAVARSAGQHPETLARKFRETLGIRMDRFINDVRIARSMRRLGESTEKVVTIAMECGFGSLSHFAEEFGKRNGMSPSRYRQRH